jgi:hypothetical protein
MGQHIKIYCGCQFVTSEIDEAQAHANQTGHTLIVQGTITSNITRDR